MDSTTINPAIRAHDDAVAPTSNHRVRDGALHYLRLHWPEYLMEAAGLGIFMVSACFFTALVEFPESPVRRLVESPIARRSIVGFAMGVTAVGIIYSPWGKQSGAHINPAVTLAFLRLSRVAPWDAAFYVGAQFAGGLAGVLLSSALLAGIVSDASVNYVVTIPGKGHTAVAFAAEFAISFGLMLTVLVMSNRPGLARLTGIGAGVLVAVYIIFEGPLSGMSMNPARTFGSALPANVWTAFWLYLIAPPLAMLAAAEVYTAWGRRRPVACAKLHHQNSKRCIFCEFHGQTSHTIRTNGESTLPSATNVRIPGIPNTQQQTGHDNRARTKMNAVEHRLLGNRIAIVTMTAVTLAIMIAVAAGFANEANAQAREHRTAMFEGAKANKGYAIHKTENGVSKLTWSEDFVVPDTPDPHWQVVDSKGNVYLLQRLAIKEDKLNRTIVVPDYVKDIAKVQIWCAWAETLLGEASFQKPVS